MQLYRHLQNQKQEEIAIISICCAFRFLSFPQPQPFNAPMNGLILEYFLFPPSKFLE
ncbi:hypothetical protein DB42_BN00630 [Neochlamydia sp. EPS4]|nr:hypothetical protein DB42_BN00630 [Neochlamydia sp. EPS4]